MGAMAGAFDVAVIGGGPGGYVAALRAAQLGAKTAIVEKDRMGGTCLVRGCIPTKALLQSSELYTLAKAGQPFGLVADNISFAWPAAQKRKGQVVDQLVKGVEGLLKAGGITSFKGSARLAGKGVVDVSGEQLQAKDIVIATGSAVARIPLPGAEIRMDYGQLLELKEVPRRLAVIGGGVVGMEFAAMFAALGSKVTVLEMLPQVLAMVDADLVAVYSKHLSKVGGEIHTDSKVSEVVKRNGALQVRFSTGGEGGAVDADQVLLAVGRTPYTQGLDAEKAGVKLDRGRVVVDDHLRTSADGVWAIGDVIGGIMLAHVASYEGVCAVENIAGHGDRVPDYHAAPNCVYTDPEIAHVGLGEKEAKEKGISVKVGKFPFAAAGRALTLGQTEGFVKVIADAESGKLLGAHIIGPRATDLIAEATLAIQNGLTLEQIDLTIHAHPTLPRARAGAVHQGEDRRLLSPQHRRGGNRRRRHPRPAGQRLDLHELPRARPRHRARRGPEGCDGGAVRQGDRHVAWARRLDAPRRLQPPIHGRLRDRGRAPAARGRRRLGGEVPQAAGRDLLHVRRRRHQHRGLPPVAQHGQGRRPSCGLVLRQQPVRHGYAGRESLRRRRHLQEGVRVRHGVDPDRWHEPARGHAANQRDRREDSPGLRAAIHRVTLLPLPRPLGRRPGQVPLSRGKALPRRASRGAERGDGARRFDLLDRRGHR